MSEHFPFPGYTVRDVSRIWCYHEQWVRTCIDQGKLRTRKSGRTVVIDPASVVALWGQPTSMVNADNRRTSTQAR